MKFLSLFHRNQHNNIFTSSLFNEVTFYPAFYKSIRHVRHELIIESPFMTVRRVNTLLPTLKKLIDSGIDVIVNTRDPREHDAYMRFEAEQSLALLLDIGVSVLFTGGLHRKIAIIDRSITWEGSLNILSQNDSCEIMRMTKSDEYALRLVTFIGIEKFLSK